MKKLLIGALLIMFPKLLFADGYWLGIKGTGKKNDPVIIKIYYGGVSDDSKRYIKSGKELDKLSDFKLFYYDKNNTKTEIAIHKESDCLEGAFTPKSEGSYQILAINENLPVVDRSSTSGKNIRPVQYLCAQYLVGSIKPTEMLPKQFLDILVVNQKDSLIIKPFKNLTSVPANTKLRIFNPENWEKLPLTNQLGQAVLYPTRKGLYIIRLDWTEQHPGDYKGQSYESVRHRCDYSLLIE